jgi:hypothetical protein
MAKQLTFVIDNQKFLAEITKVDRDKVYGYIEEVVTDKSGNTCLSGNLLDDGQTLILSGATALKTVDSNMNEVDKKSLKTVYQDGTDAVLIPSSYDGEIVMQKASIDNLFDLEVATVYQLIWEDTSAKANLIKLLQNGNLFQLVFNYRADYEGADAIMLSSQDEVYVLTGRLLDFEYLENKSIVPPIEEESTQADSEEEVDFGML